MKNDFKVNSAIEADIYDYLKDVNTIFKPSLNSQVCLKEFAKKISNHATTFELWHQNNLIALISSYFNDSTKSVGFINHVSVKSQFQGYGLASFLMKKVIEYGEVYSYDYLKLEVHEKNLKAINFYSQFRFIKENKIGHMILMSKKLGNNMSRDYNAEKEDNSGRNYFYRFDYDVMHPYMIKSFSIFFRNGNLLELGSFEGEFTKRLQKYFDDITCVEASSEAISKAHDTLGNKVKFFQSKFEEVTLPTKYDNIVMTHVLEHLDNPVKTLSRINNEWLSNTGRLLLTCPNANAPSRQIAVKMGLIDHNNAVTNAEQEHGHRITYSFDTLERDIKASGLRIVHRSGIFFKALANFQWDKLMQTDIISSEYLDGCYALGEQYPDLCSSIFFVCEKGN